MENLKSAAEIILPQTRSAAAEGGKPFHDKKIAQLWREYQETPFYTIYIILKDVPHYRASYLGITGLREHFLAKEIGMSLHSKDDREVATQTVNEHLPEGLQLYPGFVMSFNFMTNDVGHHHTFRVVHERITRIMDHLFTPREV
jgi:hypothetical protein